MATFSVKINKNDLARLERAMPAAAERAIATLAREGERYVKQSIQQSPQGANGRSQPGNPPRIDTGALINSINALSAGNMAWRISTGMDYAPMLEFGSRRMAARPFMQPMADWVGGQAGRVFGMVLKDA